MGRVGEKRQGAFRTRKGVLHRPMEGARQKVTQKPQRPETTHVCFSRLFSFHAGRGQEETPRQEQCRVIKIIIANVEGSDG